MYELVSVEWGMKVSRSALSGQQTGGVASRWGQLLQLLPTLIWRVHDTYHFCSVH
jgi:hypothetical protein